MAIELDPGTICARTNAGEIEMQEAKSGLTLPQRRALSLLSAPQVFAELAAENHLEPVRLGGDLARLAEIGLIVLLVPPARVGRSDPAVVGGAEPQHPTTAVANASKRPAMLPIAIAGAFVLAIAVVWLGLRSGPAPAATPSIDARPATLAPNTAAAIGGGVDGDANTTRGNTFPAPARVRARTSSTDPSPSRN
jgi:hypothetical protein